MDDIQRGYHALGCGHNLHDHGIQVDPKAKQAAALPHQNRKGSQAVVRDSRSCDEDSMVAQGDQQVELVQEFQKLSLREPIQTTDCHHDDDEDEEKMFGTGWHLVSEDDCSEDVMTVSQPPVI